MMADEEVSNKKFVNKLKHHPKNKLAINISPYFFILRQPSIHTRGPGGRIGWRLAMGKVADDSMVDGRGNTR
jgi:hypothetical protein